MRLGGAIVFLESPQKVDGRWLGGTAGARKEGEGLLFHGEIGRDVADHGHHPRDVDAVGNQQTDQSLTVLPAV